MPFICIMDTVADGRTASWRDETGKPCVYPTKEEAEADAFDPVIKQQAEEDGDEYEPDTVIEVIVTNYEIYDPIDGQIYWSKL